MSWVLYANNWILKVLTLLSSINFSMMFDSFVMNSLIQEDNDGSK